MSSAVWAVVVARVANGAKSRLAGVLDQGARRSLALSMLSDVLLVCVRAVDGVVAVVDDPDAQLTAWRLGALVVDDPHPGDMNAAVSCGLRAAAAQGAQTVIVLPGDIPLLSRRDLEALLAAAGQAERAVVVGASRDGQGTNALLLRPPEVIVPAFGPPSVDRHLEAGRVAGASARVLWGLDLALDVDTPADLAALAQSAGRAG
jgi:2-phospho-L-lactate guanylyltransferase